MAESRVSMKLLIDTHGKRVLFAEAGKDSVDFLFYMLSLPVSTLISLLGKHQMVGSLANLYESIENLNESYIQPNQIKDNILKPVASVSAGSGAPLLTLKKALPTHDFYRCSSCSYYVSDDRRAICPNCNRQMTSTLQYVAPRAVEEASGGGEDGLVKGVVTYMVMDDLVVTPMSTISSITLLNKFNVKEIGVLEEKVVNFGMDEAVKLLKASLQSKKVLTDVFLME